MATRYLSDAEVEAILKASDINSEASDGGPASHGGRAASHPASDLLARYQMSRASLSADEARGIEAHLATCAECQGDLVGLARFDFGAIPAAEATVPAVEQSRWAHRLRANLAWVFSNRILGYANSFALGVAAVVALMHFQLIAPGPSPAEHNAALLELNKKRIVLTEKTAALEQERAALERERVTLAERTAAMEAERLALAQAGQASPVEPGSSDEVVMRSEDRGAPRKSGEPVVVRMIADSFKGSLMLSGLAYDPSEPVAASASLPIGTRVRITNPINGQSVDVTILDKPGPESDPQGLVVSRSVYERLGYDPKRAGAPRLKQRRLDGSV